MPKKTKVSGEVLQLAIEAAEKAKTSDELRAAQAVLLPGLLDICDRISGKIIGRSRGTVVQLRKKFSTSREPRHRNWGGRRSGYMTIEQERQFLTVRNSTRWSTFGSTFEKTASATRLSTVSRLWKIN